MALRHWLIPIVTGAVCLAAGMFIARGSGGPAANGAEAGAAEARALIAAPSSAAFTLADVRRVVREEVAALQAPAARQAGAQAVAPDVEPPTHQQVAAESQALATLDAAISRRAWTAADAAALRADFDAMSPDQQAELMRRFALAINQGRLVPDGEHLPF
jgi:hypothetical protein